MEPQRYWFEEVPEEQQYWFLVPWGPSLRQEAEREGKREDSVVSPEVQAELNDIDAQEKTEELFGTTSSEAREILRKSKDLAARMEAVGYAPQALSVPWWPEVPKWEHRQGIECVQAPMLFSTKKGAEEQLRSTEDSDPASYLDLVNKVGAELADQAYSNTAQLRAVWIDRDMLLDKLEDSDFLCVMVDHKLKLRQDFIEELKKRLEEQEE